jgi:Na+/melibiose symporter-like transporter
MQRSKLITGPRMVSMIVGIVGSALITIVNGINQGVNNMHTSFGLGVTMLTVICMIVSLVGIFVIKEKYHAAKEDDEKVKILDIFRVLKHNKAERIMVIGTLFSGFIWTLSMPTSPLLL